MANILERDLVRNNDPSNIHGFHRGTVNLRLRMGAQCTPPDANWGARGPLGSGRIG
jgi:hypothetical protein